MVINYKHLASVEFPVYGVQSNDVYAADGILWLDNKVLDDRNQLGATLGARRLQTPHKLFPLRKSFSFVSEMLQSRYQHFIDSKGNFFTYEKTLYTKVRYHKILTRSLRDTGTVLKLEGVFAPLVVSRPPPPGKTWVGMLYFKGYPWLPYDYAEDYSADIRRKI